VGQVRTPQSDALSDLDLPDPGPEKERTHKHMSVARVIELSAISEQGFEDAIEQAIARATKTRKLLFHDVRE